MSVPLGEIKLDRLIPDQSQHCLRWYSKSLRQPCPTAKSILGYTSCAEWNSVCIRVCTCETRYDTMRLGPHLQSVGPHRVENVLILWVAPHGSHCLVKMYPCGPFKVLDGWINPCRLNHVILKSSSLWACKFRFQPVSAFHHFIVQTLQSVYLYCELFHGVEFRDLISQSQACLHINSIKSEIGNIHKAHSCGPVQPTWGREQRPFPSPSPPPTLNNLSPVALGLIINPTYICLEKRKKKSQNRFMSMKLPSFDGF